MQRKGKNDIGKKNSNQAFIIKIFENTHCKGTRMHQKIEA